MPKSLRYQSYESMPASHEHGGEDAERVVDLSPEHGEAILPRQEPSKIEERQIVLHTRRAVRHQPREHQGSGSQHGGRPDDRLEVADRQVPSGLSPGVARRFRITQELAKDGIDSMYMEDVTRLAHDLFSTFFPPELDDFHQPKPVPMISQAVHFEHTFIAAAWLGASSRLLMTGSDAAPSQRELRIYHSAIAQLRHAISDPVLQTHDSTIQAILHLTFKAPPPSFVRPPPAPRQSVFHTWNVVNVTSGLQITEEHLNGVKAVVLAKGGIQNVKTHHIRHLVSFQDLNYATRHLVRPSFPYVPRSAEILLVDGNHLVGSACASLDSSLFATTSEPITLGQGFARINWPPLPSTHLQPEQVWTYMVDLVSILEQFIAGDPLCNSQLLIVDQVCFVQHCLMSLLPAAQLSSLHSDEEEELGLLERQRKLQLYEIARLASIAFSHIVTHPTSATSFPRVPLTRQLLRALRNLQKPPPSTSPLSIATTASSSIHTTPADTLSPPQTQLLFWASLVGSIVSLGLPTRSGLTAQVAFWARHPMVDVRGWSDARGVLERFLWHAGTSDVDALGVWVELEG